MFTGAVNARITPLRRSIPLLLGAAFLCVLALGPAEANARAKPSFDQGRKGGILRIEGGRRADDVIVACDETGVVTLNAAQIEAGDGPLACDQVVEVDVLVAAGNDFVDLTDVTDDVFGRARYPGFGRGTATYVDAGRGNDHVLGGLKAFNQVNGRDGSDRITTGSRRDEVNGGGAGDRIVAGAGPDVVLAATGADKVRAGYGADIVNGGPDDDRLFGSDGDDRIGGWTGNDYLNGGRGHDYLIGGPGRNRIVRGPGKDRVVNAGRRG